MFDSDDDAGQPEEVKQPAGVLASEKSVNQNDAEEFDMDLSRFDVNEGVDIDVASFQKFSYSVKQNSIKEISIKNGAGR